jgi:hypothetical protein
VSSAQDKSVLSMTLPDLSIRNAQYCCMGCCSQIAPIDPDRTNCCSRGSAIACLRNYRSNLPEYDHPKSLFVRQQNRIWLIDGASFRIFPGPRCATAIQRSRRRQRFPFCRERRQSSCYQRFRRWDRQRPSAACSSSSTVRSERAGGAVHPPSIRHLTRLRRAW